MDRALCGRYEDMRVTECSRQAAGHGRLAACAPRKKNIISAHDKLLSWPGPWLHHMLPIPMQASSSNMHALARAESRNGTSAASRLSSPIDQIIWYPPSFFTGVTEFASDRAGFRVAHDVEARI